MKYYVLNQFISQIKILFTGIIIFFAFSYNNSNAATKFHIPKGCPSPECCHRLAGPSNCSVIRYNFTLMEDCYCNGECMYSKSMHLHTTCCAFQRAGSQEEACYSIQDCEKLCREENEGIFEFYENECEQYQIDHECDINPEN